MAEIIDSFYPLILSVKYELANDFRRLVEKTNPCKVEKVTELVSYSVLQYWIICPKELEAIITDYAFMTWIKNPVFQKYYHETQAFIAISENYINERQSNELRQL